MKVWFQRSEALAGMLVAMAILVCLPSGALAGTLLGSADSFAVLGASGVTNTGSSVIGGSVGSYPTPSVTSFPPGLVFNGSIFSAAEATVGTAQGDQVAAYNLLAAQAATSTLGPQLAGDILSPGVYHFASDANLANNGILTLNFGTALNQLFVFQIPTALNTGTASKIIVNGGNSSDGIFFLVGSSAVLGTTTSFVGNILAHTSITLNTGATIECGRAFAATGAVTLDSNVISNNCSQALGTTGIVLPTDSGSQGFSSPGSTAQLFSPEPGTFLLLSMSLVGLAAKFSARKK